MTERITILAVDDHPLLREGITGLISSQPDLLMVGEASTGQEAVALFKATLPDVTLMDLQMPDMSGVEAIAAIKREFAAAKIIVLTTFAGDILAQRALKAGAHAYILKSTMRKDLLETIRAVHRGQRRIHADVATQLAHHMGSAGLTAREVEVLGLVAQGHSNRAIGETLFVNEVTIKGHLKNILAKLGARDRTHAVTIGLRRGIIELQDPTIEG